jgi:hypothetical protein
LSKKNQYRSQRITQGLLDSELSIQKFPAHGTLSLSPYTTHTMASSEEDDMMDNMGDLEDDLFGDDDDEEPPEKVRELSDRELDSGDDEDRNDRAAREEAEEVDYGDGRDVQIQESIVWRHPVPKPVDGEVSVVIIDLKLISD